MSPTMRTTGLTLALVALTAGVGRAQQLTARRCRSKMKARSLGVLR